MLNPIEKFKRSILHLNRSLHHTLQSFKHLIKIVAAKCGNIAKYGLSTISELIVLENLKTSTWKKYKIVTSRGDRAMVNNDST